MKNRKPNHRSLETIASRASLWAVTATMSLVFLFTAIAVIQEKHSQLDAETRRLSTIGQSMARSISAEILLGDDKSVEALLQELKRQYELSELTILDEAPEKAPEAWIAKIIPAPSATRVETLPGLSQTKVLQIESLRSKRGVFSGWLAILLVLFPLTLFGVITTLKIQRDLHRSIIEPIQKLARDPEHWAAEGPWVAEEAIQLHGRFCEYMRERDSERDRAEQLKIEASIGQMAAQVAHDIRSPLAALDMVAGLLTNVPEQKRVIIRSALSRIRDIANGLLIRNRVASEPSAALRIKVNGNREKGLTQGEELNPELLSSLVDSLITEKRVQYRSRWGVEIETPLSTPCYGLFARVEPTEFKRVLSNLIDNGVEALGDKGRVWIELSSNEEHVLVHVKDNGKGVPVALIPKLTQKGKSFGKTGGAGLGLYSARVTVESWGGSMHIRSEVDKGTEIELQIPKSPVPHWFVPEIVLKGGSLVVILDDDSTIHQVWQGRFESLRPSENEIEVIHLSNSEDFRQWFAESPPREKVFLIDYELIGSKHTGLELIANLGIKDRAVLVTSRFEERAIRAACSGLGVRLIPKSLAGFVPIRVDRETTGLPKTTAAVSKINPRHPAI